MVQAIAVTTDVLVLGSGAAGLTAAVTARLHGLDVVVLEKEAVFGGTTAWSGGVVWIPCNSHQQTAQIHDSRDAARDYIKNESGEFYRRDHVEAYLANAPEMLDFMEKQTNVKFDLSAAPDYHPSAPGGMSRGRSLRPISFDCRQLGDAHVNLRQPPRERVLFMGMQISGADLSHFMNATQSVGSALHVTRRVLEHCRDVLFYGRGMRADNGNALVARLAKTAIDLKIPIRLSSRASELMIQNDVAVGAIAEENNESVRFAARKAVILACGGFPHDYHRRQLVFPHHPSRAQHLSAAPPSNIGEGISLGESVGAGFESGYTNSGAWSPVSRATYPDGSTGNYAHVIERGKPGVIAVTPRGKRFTNEAQSYHDFVQAMISAREHDDEICAFFVCDDRALKRYGLGVVRPWPLPHGLHLRSGYLKRGMSIGELAEKAGIHCEYLLNTINQYNHSARQGIDPEFKKGTSAYDISQGDVRHRPNPCVGPLERPPFYAVKVLPGDLGTFAGLKTDEHARVLSKEGLAIAGLYAVGNDQASVFGGAYPGAGATLGPAMTFGYIAGRHAAGLV